MARKTVVFGSSYAVRKFIANKENRDNFVNVRNIDNLRGIEIEAIIKLEGWKNCYDKPSELMDEAEYRLNKYKK